MFLFLKRFPSVQSSETRRRLFCEHSKFGSNFNFFQMSASFNLSPADVLNYWFSDEVKPNWFKSRVIDEELREKFSEAHHLARQNLLPEWKLTAEGALAVTLILDQFSRNIFRNTPDAFSSDPIALENSKQAIEKGFDSMLTQSQKMFLYMPFLHSEDLESQKQSLQLFSSLGDGNIKFAQTHHDVVARFGRFPSRNAIIGRDSTPEELEWLAGPEGSKWL